MTLSTWLLLSTTILAPLAAYMMFFNRGNSFPVAGRTVIVTGGSQGLGLSLATLLASKGANVVIVAQTVSKLEKALAQIETASPSRDSTSKSRHMYLSHDLRDPASAPKIINAVTEWSGAPPDIVINCAGNCVPGFFADQEIDTLRGQMDTIYWSCAYMAHAALRAWTKPGKQTEEMSARHIVFVASVLALYTIPGYAAYTPAKAAMRSLADTLNGEVQVYNGARKASGGPAADIKVHIAFPTGILTPGFEVENATKSKLTQKLEEDDKPQQPEELARIIISELESGKFLITASFIGNVMKGWSMGGSQRSGIGDYLYNWLGNLIVPFITSDHFSKSWKWGREKGLAAATE